jgi:hypothetical protein
MKDLDHLHHFFGMTVSHSFGCLFLSQRHYMLEILDRVDMFDCKPCTTPVDTSTKLSVDGPPIDDATHYHGIPGALQYLTFTRPNIAHVVQHICLHMHDPQAPHLALVKGVLRYVKDTLDHGLMLHHSSSTGLMDYSLF